MEVMDHNGASGVIYLNNYCPRFDSPSAPAWPGWWHIMRRAAGFLDMPGPDLCLPGTANPTDDHITMRDVQNRLGPN